MTETRFTLEDYRGLLEKVLALHIRKREELLKDQIPGDRDWVEFLRYCQYEINGLCIAIRLTNPPGTKPEDFPVPSNQAFDYEWAKDIPPPPEDYEDWM